MEEVSDEEEGVEKVSEEEMEEIGEEEEEIEKVSEKRNRWRQ